ncbi:hypothetical protein GCM10009601_26420 [Streptomyces thermospinosisporus]|uniref:Uncharacterized protein n=1 Tax=Streptomyces thermospinosisporus TaxID=161482 RepID=A0ABN1YZ26_9ACTN
MHDEFLCHVTAYGVCDGRRIGVPLGTYRAPTLALALWWLRGPARQEEVAEALAAGRLVRIATGDDTTEYELLAESVDALRMQRAAPVLGVPVA